MKEKMEVSIRDRVLRAPSGPIPEETAAAIADMMASHEPTPEQVANYRFIREILCQAVEDVLEACPPCPDRTRAITALREARMWANSAIALKGRW